jgi:hypothetical protein
VGRKEKNGGSPSMLDQIITVTFVISSVAMVIALWRSGHRRFCL